MNIQDIYRMIKRSSLGGMVGGAKEKNLEIINKAIGVIGSDER